MTSHRLRTGERLCGAATENTDRGGERIRRLADGAPACGPEGALAAAPGVPGAGARDHPPLRDPRTRRRPLAPIPKPGERLARAPGVAGIQAHGQIGG